MIDYITQRFKDFFFYLFVLNGTGSMYSIVELGLNKKKILEKKGRSSQAMLSEAIEEDRPCTLNFMELIL